MSLVREAILSVAKEGEITHKFTIKGLDFELRSLKTEEQILADGMLDSKTLKTKYGAQNVMTLADTIEKYRTLARVALATKAINGSSPVDTGSSYEEQFKQRLELRDELMELGAAAVDRLAQEYNKLVKKEQEFFSDIEQNLEK